MSERRACKVIGQSRTSQRYEFSQDLSRDYFRKKVLEVSLKYNRYGYRKITSYLENEGLKRGFELVRRIRGRTSSIKKACKEEENMDKAL